MISIKLILFSLLTSLVTGASLLERLLDSTIKSAMCEARCGGLEDAEDAQVCLEVCDMVTRNPRTASVCSALAMANTVCWELLSDEVAATPRTAAVKSLRALAVSLAALLVMSLLPSLAAVRS